MATLDSFQLAVKLVSQLVEGKTEIFSPTGLPGPLGAAIAEDEACPTDMEEVTCEAPGECPENWIEPGYLCRGGYDCCVNF